MGTTVAFLAQCQGSASLEEQQAALDPDDHVLIAGKHSFNKLEDLLFEHGFDLSSGDRVKVYDLSCIELSTTTLIRLITGLMRKGVAFEIITNGLVLHPNRSSDALRLLEALDGHYRHIHGVKTQRTEGGTRGRRRLLEPDKLAEIRSRLAEPGVTATEVAQGLGVARSTLFNFLERYDREREIGRGKKRVERSAKDGSDAGHIAEGDID